MKKILFLMLYCSMLYTAENFNNMQIDSKYNFKSIAFNDKNDCKHNLTLDFAQCDEDEFLSVAIFKYSQAKSNLNLIKLLSKKDVQTDLKFLVQLLNDSFSFLMEMNPELSRCLSDNDRDNFLKDVMYIDCNELVISINHEMNLIDINKENNYDYGLFVGIDVFYNLLQDWQKSLHEKSPFVVVSESSDLKLKIMPLQDTSAVKAYLKDHNVK